MRPGRRELDVDGDLSGLVGELDQRLAVGDAACQRRLDFALDERGKRPAARDLEARSGDEQADRAPLGVALEVELVDRDHGCLGGVCRCGQRKGHGYTGCEFPSLQGARFSMKRKAYGRDAGLTLRILLTGGLLGLVYVLFGAVLISFLNVGLIPMLVIIAGIAIFQYYTSDKLALLASGAKVVERDQAPELHDMIERLCALADLPKPKVAVIDTEVPNAFATGRNPKNSAVAVTTGLWNRLEPREVEGVLAHELSHIANRDVLIMTLAGFFAMVAGLVMRWGFLFGGGGNRDRGGAPAWLIIFVVSVVTYVLSYVLIRTISRYREYAADRGAALITGAPENLMSALQKIASRMTQIPQRDLREVEAMNAFFIIPTNVKSSLGELFSTHPPLEKRLRNLEKVAREMGKL